MACNSCHNDIHAGQFDLDGVTDCASCHMSENWIPVNFNHDLTAFELVGKHAELDCVACHKINEYDKVEVIQYKLKSFECIDCH